MQTKSTTADLRLPIPSASKGIWSWLQPYPDGDGAGGRQYKALDVGEDGKILLFFLPVSLRVARSGIARVSIDCIADFVSQMGGCGWIRRRIRLSRGFCCCRIALETHQMCDCICGFEWSERIDSEDSENHQFNSIQRLWPDLISCQDR